MLVFGGRYIEKHNNIYTIHDILQINRNPIKDIIYRAQILSDSVLDVLIYKNTQSPTYFRTSIVTYKIEII